MSQETYFNNLSPSPTSYIKYPIVVMESVLEFRVIRDYKSGPHLSVDRSLTTSSQILLISINKAITWEGAKLI